MLFSTYTFLFQFLPAVVLAFVAARRHSPRAGILVLAGVEHPHLFDENWKVFEQGLTLAEGDEAEIAALRESYDRVFCHRCDYCQPCPRKIAISVAMNIRSFVRRFNMKTCRDWFTAPMANVDQCNQCGRCEKRCPFDLPIRRTLRENSLFWKQL